MKTIFILSCWRSGTSWLEDILGKRVEGSRLFGHEQQILPLLSMYKKCFYDNSAFMRKKANKPICDIEKDDFYKELGLKQHKVLVNARKKSGEEFNSFALRFIDFLLEPYKKQYKQVVEKSPENGSPEVFNCAIDIFGNVKDFVLVYLFREFEPYLSSCYEKFIKRGIHDIDYYVVKWLLWNGNAIDTLKQKKLDNLFVLKYEDLVNDPSIISNFRRVWKQAPKIRDNVLAKWKKSRVLDQLMEKYNDNKESIDKILQFVNENKIISNCVK